MPSGKFSAVDKVNEKTKDTGEFSGFGG